MVERVEDLERFARSVAECHLAIVEVAEIHHDRIKKLNANVKLLDKDLTTAAELMSGLTDHVLTIAREVFPENVDAE